MLLVKTEDSTSLLVECTDILTLHRMDTAMRSKARAQMLRVSAGEHSAVFSLHSRSVTLH